MPCCANVLLNSVDSITPGNFFALKTWKGLVNTEARTGAAAVLSVAPAVTPEEFADAGVKGDVGFDDELFGVFDSPTFTKLNFRLWKC
jgi:hypothetical protein